MSDKLSQSDIDRLLGGDTSSSALNGLAILTSLNDLDQIRRVLQQAGSTTTSISSTVRDSWEVLHRETTERVVDLLLVDLQSLDLNSVMGDTQGVFLRDMARRGVPIVILVSSSHATEAAGFAETHGLFGYLTMPLEEADAIRMCRAGLAMGNMRRVNG